MNSLVTSGLFHFPTQKVCDLGHIADSTNPQSSRLYFEIGIVALCKIKVMVITQ